MATHPPTRWPMHRHPHARRRRATEFGRGSPPDAAGPGRGAAGDAGGASRDPARRTARRAGRSARPGTRRATRSARRTTRHWRRTADQRPLCRPRPPSPRSLAREDAEGLPVPIVPGTRVTEAEARPPAPAVPPLHLQHGPAIGSATLAPAAAGAGRRRRPANETVEGEICATEERAKADARRALQAEGRRVARARRPQRPGRRRTPLLQALVARDASPSGISPRSITAPP